MIASIGFLATCGGSPTAGMYTTGSRQRFSFSSGGGPFGGFRLPSAWLGCIRAASAPAEPGAAEPARARGRLPGARGKVPRRRSLALWIAWRGFGHTSSGRPAPLGEGQPVICRQPLVSRVVAGLRASRRPRRWGKECRRITLLDWQGYRRSDHGTSRCRCAPSEMIRADWWRCASPRPAFPSSHLHLDRALREPPSFATPSLVIDHRAIQEFS